MRGEIELKTKLRGEKKMFDSFPIVKVGTENDKRIDRL